MLTSSEFLSELRRRGARRIRCVRFRKNRNTIWSLTQNRTVLNVHAAFTEAPPPLLDAFAIVAMAGGVHTPESRRASEEISNWPRLAEAFSHLRHAHAERGRAGGADGEGTHCCATAEQRSYLRVLYAYFNHTRFGGTLPVDVPIRLSRRMRSSLGHMLPGERPGGERFVVEIALNCDLMLEGNGAERVDTLLHEMAHVADYLESGSRGHGPSWRQWARHAGCQPTRLYDRPVRYRRDRTRSVGRVPPLPHPLVEMRLPS